MCQFLYKLNTIETSTSLADHRTQRIHLTYKPIVYSAVANDSCSCRIMSYSTSTRRQTYSGSQQWFYNRLCLSIDGALQRRVPGLLNVCSKLALVSSIFQGHLLHFFGVPMYAAIAISAHYQSATWRCRPFMVELALAYCDSPSVHFIAIAFYERSLQNHMCTQVLLVAREDSHCVKQASIPMI
jgi:hypothetical protein